MKQLLPFLLLLFWVSVASGQVAQTNNNQSQEVSTQMWQPVQPEKLLASELMILPSNKFLRLKLREDPGHAKVVIQDLNGNTLIENSFATDRDVDISILKPGNYLIKVISATRVLQGKFGKRRL